MKSKEGVKIIKEVGKYVLVLTFSHVIGTCGKCFTSHMP